MTRFIMVGLAMAVVGVATGVRALVAQGNSIPPLSVWFVIVGLMFAGVAMLIGIRDKRSSDEQ